MRNKEEVVREFIKNNPEKIDPQNHVEILKYKRERMMIEVMLEIRDLLKEEMDGAWLEVAVDDSVPDPTT